MERVSNKAVVICLVYLITATFLSLRFMLNRCATTAKRDTRLLKGMSRNPPWHGKVAVMCIDCQVISQPALTSHTPSTAEGNTSQASL